MPFLRWLFDSKKGESFYEEKVFYFQKKERSIGVTGGCSIGVSEEIL
jgi:hypothetical protein